MYTQVNTDNENIVDIIVSFIREELVEDEWLDIDTEENLLAGGLIDSVGIVRLVAHLKERLGVQVPPKDLIPDNFRTVQVMASYMKSLR